MNKNVIIASVALVLVVAAVISYQLFLGSSTQVEKSEGMETEEVENTDMDVAQPDVTAEATGSAEAMTDAKSYTLEDIAKHSKAEDCWLAIEGKVYDVTPYIQKQIHPGGAAILFGCGKDATAVFNLRPKDNKPHSQKARGYLSNYYIGELAK